MAVTIMQNVWKSSRAKGNDRLLLLAIADNAGEDGYAFPGYKTLTAKMNASRETVKASILAAEAAGELYVDRSRRNNRYIVLPDLTDQQIEKALRLHFELDGPAAHQAVSALRLKQAHQSRLSTNQKQAHQSRLSTNRDQSRVSTSISLDSQPYIGLDPRLEPPDNHHLTINNNQQQLDQESTESVDRPTPIPPAAAAGESERPTIFKLYEQATGLLITELVANELKAWEDEYPADWIADAFKEMASAGAKNVKYPKAILDRWRVQGKESSRDKSATDLPVGRAGTRPVRSPVGAALAGGSGAGPRPSYLTEEQWQQELDRRRTYRGPTSVPRVPGQGDRVPPRPVWASRFRKSVPVSEELPDGGGHAAAPD